MGNKEIRYFLIVCMGVSLLTSVAYPEMLISFGISAACLFGVILVDERHHDEFKDFRRDLNSVTEVLNKHTDDLEDIYLSRKVAASEVAELRSASETLSKELKSLEPEKLKSDMKTLIESNNQIVMKMSMGNAFGGMNG